MIAQRIVAIALGYEDLNDHQTLATTRPSKWPPGGFPTMSRHWPRLRRSAAWKTVSSIGPWSISPGYSSINSSPSHPEPPEHLILDFDATDDPIHGHQEERFFHGYYDNYCYLPLYVFCGDELVAAYLRPSNIDASKHSRALLKLLVRRLRQAWPDVKLTIRADSGFCRWRLMRWCDSHGVGYVLGLARNPVLERLAADWTAQAERQFRRRASRSESSARSLMRPRVGTDRGE